MADKIVLFNNNQFDEAGSWTAGGDAESVTTDTNEFKVGTGSVNYDIDVSDSAANQATLANTTFTAHNLTAYEDTGSFRVWVYIPDVTYTNTVGFRWGSSSAVYWEQTMEKTYKNQAFVDGWNLVQFNWSQELTEVGSPAATDAANIAYYRVAINYSSSQADETDYRLDAITLANGFDNNDVYAVTYFRNPARIANEMDQLDIPVGHGSLLLDSALANLMLRYENRDTLSTKLIDKSDKKRDRFLSQASKRTRRPIGGRPFGRTRNYTSRSGGFRTVNRNYDVYFPQKGR